MLASWSPDEWADVITAATGFLWPILIGWFVLMFRRPLRALIERNRELEGPGFRAKFDPDPGPVQAVRRQLDVVPPEATTEAPRDEEPEAELAPVVAPSLYDEVTDLASRDVRVGLLRLFDALEARIRDLASAWGGLDPHTPNWRQLLDALVEKGVIPKGVASNVTLLDQVRNAAIHNASEYQQGDVFAALDAGLDLLIALDGIPLQGYEIVEKDVVLYRDEACTQPWQDATGVIVRQRKPKGRTGQRQGPYPTRERYNEGDIVGWQWTFAEPVLEFYWPAPDGRAHHIRSAWFVGEHLRGV